MDRKVFEFRGLNVLDSKNYKVVVDDGIITDLSECHDVPKGNYFCPGGLIDTQVNGCLGYNYTGEDLSVDQVRQICMELARHGTLQHFATIITSSQERILRSLDVIVRAIGEDPFVRRSITGIHIEGNYISRLDGPRGAHNIAYVRDASIEEFDSWYDHSRGLLKYITIGAEANGAEDLIRHAVKKGVVVSIGHTGATRDQIDRAAEAGASASTHLGNGVFAKLDRFENPIWPQLRNQRLTTGLIADGDHVIPDLVWVISRCKDKDHIILVSDLHHCAGLEPGRRMDGPLEIEIFNDAAVRVAGTPYLAGAGVHLLKCTYNYGRFTQTDPVQAFRLSTVNPIRKYDLDPQRAVMKVGNKAEFIAFTDTGKGYGLKAVFADGQSVIREGDNT